MIRKTIQFLLLYAIWVLTVLVQAESSSTTNKSETIGLKPDNAEVYLNRGNMELEKKQFTNAITDYTKAIKLKPDYAEAYIYRGEAKNRNNDSGGGVVDCTKAIDLQPTNAQAYYKRGLFCTNYDRKIADFTKVIELKPDYVDAYYWRGCAKTWKNDFGGAVADYTKTIELKPDYADAYLKRGDFRTNIDEKISDYTRVIELKPDYVEAYFQRGVFRTNIDEKIADYTKAIELMSNNAEAYYHRGILRTNTDEAIADFTKVIELKPDFAEAYFRRANAKFVKSDRSGVIVDMTKGLELKPDPEVYYYRGMLRTNIDEKITDYTKAIELKPDNAFAYFYRGNAKTWKDNYVGAVADYSKAIELRPDYAEAYVNRGKSRADYDGKISDFSKAIELKPNYADAYLQRGEILANIDEAIKDFSKTIELMPDCAEAYACRAAYDLGTKKVDLAMADINAAIDHGYGIKGLAVEKDSYYIRAKVYMAMNDWDNALADMKRSVEIKPTADHLLWRGLIFLGKNDYANALSDANKSISLEANNPMAYLLRAKIKEQKGDETSALADLDSAIIQNPKLEEAVTLRNEIRDKTQVTPQMKVATRTVWNRIQAIEAQLSKDYANDKKNQFSQRGFLYAQIDTQGADLYLIKYVSQIVDVSKDTRAVLDAIDQEKQQTEQTAKNVEGFFTVLGAFLGATANNNRGIAQNTQDGQAAGMVVGKIEAGLINSAPSSTFDGDIKRCQSNLELMSSKFKNLQEYLSKKYKTQFLSGF